MKKTFDCVKMKHDIQQEILREMEGLSSEEKRQWTERAILSETLSLRAFGETHAAH